MNTLMQGPQALATAGDSRAPYLAKAGSDATLVGIPVKISGTAAPLSSSEARPFPCDYNYTNFTRLGIAFIF